MEETKGEIILFKSSDGPELQVSFVNDSLWMTQAQISVLYQTDRSSITKHLKNIVNSGELQEKSNVQNLHIANSDKPVKLYSLDFILSVGYRVNSKKATQFRIWATQRLRDYLLKGYLVNEKRLRETQDLKIRELQQAHKFIQQALETKRLEGYEKELGNIISDYTQTWVTLSRYDDGDLELDHAANRKINELTYERVKKAVEHFKVRLLEKEHVSGTFGREAGARLSEIMDRIKTSDLVLEEKSAELFYSIIKEKPFLDGNKRIAALLFVLFLIENHALYDKKGVRKFNDASLVAIALLIEESKPSEKKIIVNLISNLVNRKV